MADLRANRARLQADFDVLAALGRAPDGGLQREAWTPAFLDARAFVAQRLAEAGLHTRVDAIGNLFGRAAGPDAPVVLSGSHLDAVPCGGTFDGAAGVIAALEAVRRIVEAGVSLVRPLDVVGFVEEEGRFTGLLGSAVMMSLADLDRVRGTRDTAGATFETALGAAGLNPAELGSAIRDPREIGAFVELHVEQGAVLEQAGLPIGVVTAIAGTHRLSVHLRGRTDHTGATPMECRYDAPLVAAEVIAAARRLTLAKRRETARATVGQMFVDPNVTSAVPGDVTLVVDVRRR